MTAIPFAHEVCGTNAARPDISSIYQFICDGFISKGAEFLGWVKVICYIIYLYYVNNNISICYEKVTESNINTHTTYVSTGSDI